MTLQASGAKVAALFQTRFGHAPKWLVAAPGRVNFIGEHTDYNDGFVLPMAIDCYTVMAADLGSQPGVMTVYDAAIDQSVVIDVSGPVTKGQPSWTNYIRGVLAGWQRRGGTIPGLDVALLSTVPLGAGLSSSAALEVCTAALMEAVSGQRMDPVERALMAQAAEHEFAGMPCGIMDQFISSLGRASHLLLIDCRSRTTSFVSMQDPEVCVLIINTNVKHELTGSEYGQRRAECTRAAAVMGIPALRDATLTDLERHRTQLGEVVFRRARHVIGENERTLQAAEALRQKNWAAAGQAMYASHDSLRDDYEVSCMEVDCVVEAARSIGVAGGIFGCRITGGGFGGCCVALVKASLTVSIADQIQRAYRAGTGREATIFSSQAAEGAAILRA